MEGAGIAEWLASRTSKQEGPVRIPVGAKKFGDGTRKYLPYAELLLCLNYTFVCCLCLY